MPRFSVSDRSFVTLSGEDAEVLLQGLITTDLAQLQAGELRPGALLTPQGKILFDFLIFRDGETLVIDIDSAQAPLLLKRLTMYKLRAAVALSLSTPQTVTVIAGEADAPGYRDIRFEKSGQDVRRAYDLPHEDAGVSGSFDAFRIASGIVVAGRDYALQDAFPHDVLLDLNGGLSFRKGCYVGQEVVSRMQHRGTARRRVVIVTGEAALPEPATPLTAGGKLIGTLGSVSDEKGLAIVRIDKAGEAIADGVPVLAGDVPVTLSLPAWTGLSFPSTSDEARA